LSRHDLTGHVADMSKSTRMTQLGYHPYAGIISQAPVH
jgi:hypothetical protein